MNSKTYNMKFGNSAALKALQRQIAGKTKDLRREPAVRIKK